MGKLKDILIIIAVSFLSALVILIFSSVLLIHNINFYKTEFEKNSVYGEFGDKIYVNKIAENLINYFSDTEELANVYSEREVIHLKDVKNLINFLEKFLFVVFGLLLIICFTLFYKNYKYFHWIFIYSSVAVCFIILISILFSITNFSLLFNLFHRVSFSNEFWLLEENSTLIRLFPEQFFIDALTRIMIYSLVISLIFLTFGLYLKSKRRK